MNDGWNWVMTILSVARDNASFNHFAMILVDRIRSAT